MISVAARPGSPIPYGYDIDSTESFEMARPLPPERKLGHQKLIALDDEMNRRLDEYRFAASFKSEAAAIRALMRLGFTLLEEKGTFVV